MVFIHQKEITINKLFKTLILIVCIFINIINAAYAQVNINPCEPKPIIFAFFNSVQITRKEASIAKEKLKILYVKLHHPLIKAKNDKYMRYKLFFLSYQRQWQLVR